MSEVNITPLGAFLLGQQIRLNLAAVREPVAYLYNGVRLPKLPEWDKTVYPYAYIRKTTYASGQHYTLYVFSCEVYVTSSGLLYPIATPISYRAGTNGDNFALGDEKTYTSTPILTGQKDIIWANFDMKYDDGTLRIFASEPVPVYE